MMYRYRGVLIALCLAGIFALGCGSGPKYKASSDTREYFTDKAVSVVRWRKKDIYFRVIGGPSGELGSKDRGRIKGAIDNWNALAKGKLVFHEAQGIQLHDVSIEWAGSLGKTPTGKKILGDTKTQKVFDKGFLWIESARLLLLDDLQKNFLLLGRTVLHEWGHVCGIQGHPNDLTNYGSVMNDPIPGNIYYPQQIDYNTFHLIYP